MKQRKLNIIIAAVSVTFLATACAPRINPDLERVQGQLVALKSDSVVVASAPTEVNDANLAVERAETTWQKYKDRNEVEHLSYLAEKRMELARVKAAQRVAENQATSYSQGRDRIQTLGTIQDARRIESRGALFTVPGSQVTTTTTVVRTKEFSNNFPGLITTESSRGYIVTINDGVFIPGSATLKASASESLLPLAIYLRNNAREIAYVEGYLDSNDSPSTALDFSERRANAVRDYIIDQGVSPNRISATGLGSQFPVASNATASGRLQNRRIEVILK
jgi:outer membrane protein OmpA-like peptidoglycan-associated protein